MILYKSKIRKALIISFLLVTSHFLYAQHQELFSRLGAIQNRTVTFYNVDGIEITSQKVDTEFLPKNIAKKYRQLQVSAEELKVSDTAFHFRNYYVLKTNEEAEGHKALMAYYFVETADKKVMAITFASIDKSDKSFERTFVLLLRNGEIPASVFYSPQTDSLNFAGRKLYLAGACHWMGVNNVQCPHYGQMDWSVHATLEDAKQTIDNHYVIMAHKNGGKVVSDKAVPVVFEGVETTARQIIYDFTGVTSALVAMSGGKTLTIYQVAAPVRGNYVSCTMSFWNNDKINDSGLAPLLDEVMKLK